jgi:spore coat polysaccharide biosynthesis protein SpsF
MAYGLRLYWLVRPGAGDRPEEGVDPLSNVTDTSDLVIVLTARMNSERLPGKAMADVHGTPLIGWIVQRLQGITPNVVLATTTRDEDLALTEYGHSLGLPIYSGSEHDVVERMELGRQSFPEAQYVMRGLGDCPFMEPRLVQRALMVMRKTQRDCFRWHLPPTKWPVYGAREFPYGLGAWQQIYKRTRLTGYDYKAHVDLYYHEHLDEFNVVWHEAPAKAYFRPYRLEVDWPEDLALIREIARSVGMLAPLPEIINFLDSNQAVAHINRERVERTGMSTYNYDTQRTWMHDMEGQSVITWDNMVWGPPDSKAKPIFCQADHCMMGFASGDVLYTRYGKIRGAAYLTCACGADLVWRDPLPRGTGRGSLSPLF